METKLKNTKGSLLKQGMKKEFNKEELYYQALYMAFEEFIEEEKIKNIFTEARLMAKIEAARELYKRY